jgi:hypothetical protein
MRRGLASRVIPPSEEVRARASSASMFIRTLKQGAGLLLPHPKGDDFFSNVNCQYNDVALVPLNDAERYNVAAIKKVEASKGCL